MSALTLTDAQSIVAGAVRKAGELGIAVSVVVLDAHGHTVQISRMDGAGWFTPKIAFGKAYGASAFRRDSAALVDLFESRQLFAGAFTAMSDGNMAIGAGGLVVRSGDQVVGAVGVSGGTTDQDVLCARAGLDGWLQR